MVAELKTMLNGIVEGENILADDHPIYEDHIYVADGVVIASPIFGTVKRLKFELGAKEIRRCNLAKRNLF